MGPDMLLGIMSKVEGNEGEQMDSMELHKWQLWIQKACVGLTIPFAPS